MSVRSDKAQDERSDGMNKVQTTGGISLSPELFEQLYLAPKQNVHGHLRERFGNPTPIGEHTRVGILTKFVEATDDSVEKPLAG